MNKLDEAMRRSRETKVPAQLRNDLERSVMQKIGGRKAGRPRYGIHALRLATAGVAAVLLAVVFLRSGRKQSPPQAQFTESVILLDDHVCIWLEPLDQEARP